MKTCYLRIVAVLLVPCLLADLISAPAFAGSPIPWGQTVGGVGSGFQTLFEQETLAGEPLPSPLHEILGPQKAAEVDRETEAQLGLNKKFYRRHFLQNGIAALVVMLLAPSGASEAPLPKDSSMIRRLAASGVFGIRPVQPPSGQPEIVSAPSRIPGPKTSASFNELAQTYGKRYGIDPLLIKIVTQDESGFDPSAKSGRNARGSMQLLPSTALELAKRIHLISGDQMDEAMLDEEDPNVHLGSRYLCELSYQYGGHLVTVLAAYNAGPHRVDQWLASTGKTQLDISDIPYMETKNYVTKITGEYTRMGGDLNRPVAKIRPNGTLLWPVILLPVLLGVGMTLHHGLFANGSSGVEFASMGWSGIWALFLALGIVSNLHPSEAPEWDYQSLYPFGVEKAYLESELMSDRMVANITDMKERFKGVVVEARITNLETGLASYIPIALPYKSGDGKWRALVQDIMTQLDGYERFSKFSVREVSYGDQVALAVGSFMGNPPDASVLFRVINGSKKSEKKNVKHPLDSSA